MRGARGIPKERPALSAHQPLPRTPRGCTVCPSSLTRQVEGKGALGMRQGMAGFSSAATLPCSPPHNSFRCTPNTLAARAASRTQAGGCHGAAVRARSRRRRLPRRQPRRGTICIAAPSGGQTGCFLTISPRKQRSLSRRGRNAEGSMPPPHPVLLRQVSARGCHAAAVRARSCQGRLASQ